MAGIIYARPVLALKVLVDTVGNGTELEGSLL